MTKLPTLIPEAERYPQSCQFRQIYDAFKHGRVITKSTQARYRAVEVFIDWLRDRPITPSVIDEWHAYQKALNRNDYFILRRLQTVYKWGIRMGYLLNDPFVGKLNAPSRRHKWKPINHDTWLRMAKALKGYYHYIPWVMCYETAMSYVDVCQLRWDMIDMETGIIRGKRVKMRSREGGVFETKVDPNGLSWPLLVNTQQLLEKKGDKATEEERTYVFPRIMKRHLMRNLAMIMRKAGFKESEIATFHDLRRTRITAMVNSGVPFNIVMKVSGHSSHSQLLGYVGVDSSAIQSAVVSSVQFSRVCKNQHSPSQLSSVPTDLLTSSSSASAVPDPSSDPTRRSSSPTTTPSTQEGLRKSLTERAARLSRVAGGGPTAQGTGKPSSTAATGPKGEARTSSSSSPSDSSHSKESSKAPF